MLTHALGTQETYYFPVPLYSALRTKEQDERTSLVVQWLRICLAKQGTHSIPGQRTKSPHALEQPSPNYREVHKQQLRLYVPQLRSEAGMPSQ